MNITERTVTRIGGGRMESLADPVAVEAPLEIRLGDVPIAVVMRTPGDDADLVRGFSLTEGIVLHPDEIAEIVTLDHGDRWALVPRPDVEIDPEQFRRNLYTTSSCGVCGKASIDAVRIAAAPLPDGPHLTPRRLARLVESLPDRQPGFAVTGGLHAAAIAGQDGEIETSAEDVGRHNAVDRAIGALARRRWPPGPSTLVVSGRISFEITQKAAVAGIPAVVGVSAATSLAVDLATEVGMTLVGFARGETMVIYAGGERIASGET